MVSLTTRLSNYSLYVPFIATNSTMTTSTAPTLYRALMRSAKAINDYNFRTYAVRRVKAGFNTNKAKQGEELTAAISYGEEQLKILQRQSLLTNLYPSTQSVMET